MVLEGFFADYCPKNRQNAYSPKYIALNIILDSNGKPWLAEIERGLSHTRLFNSDEHLNRTLTGLAHMYVFPLAEGQQVQ